MTALGTTGAICSITARSLESWAGPRRFSSSTVCVRPSRGIASTRLGGGEKNATRAPRWTSFRGAPPEGEQGSNAGHGPEGNSPRRRHGNAPKPSHEGGEQAAAARLRQAAGLLPALGANARWYPEHSHSYDAPGSCRV